MTAAASAAVKTRAVSDLFAAKTMVFGLRLMQDFKLSDVQAAGVFGNLGHESGGFKLLQEIKPVVAGSRGGYGWAQWTGPRRRAFEAWCKAEKMIPSTDEASYGYLCVELRGPEAGAVTALRKAKDLAAATDAFCRGFERPGVVNLPSRMTWAKKALAAIQKGLAAHEAETVAVKAAPPAALAAPAKAAKTRAASDKHAVSAKPARKTAPKGRRRV